MSADAAATEVAALSARRGRFDDRLAAAGCAPLRRDRVRTLQVNLGLRCNLACHHCHVESGPLRTEALGSEGVDRLLELLDGSPDVAVLDITGGAPELHPLFETLVRGARERGRRVIDRCNLTVLFEPGQESTAAFLAAHEVEIVASLPCYSAENVEAQRGRGVFAQSIEALRALGGLGYGRGGGLVLDLVYNPIGASLPPPQDVLEAEFRDALQERHGIEFDRLLTITNMPIKRFARTLAREGRDAEYMSLLVRSFNPDTVPELMCRTLVSVDHRGLLSDCDFNQALGLRSGSGLGSIWDLLDLSRLEGAAIATDEHCFGCTAGAGSSCGGALSGTA